MHDGVVPARSYPSAPSERPAVAATTAVTETPPSNPLERPLSVIRRYKWLIVAMTLAAGCVGIAASRMIKPKYEVKATIWVSTDSKTGSAGPIRSAELLNAGAWIELFRSFHVVDEVVRRLSLFLKPASAGDAPIFAGFRLADRFVPGAYELEIHRDKQTWILRRGATGPLAIFGRGGGVVLARGTANDSVGVTLGFQWQIPQRVFQGSGDRRIKFSVSTPRETSVDVLKRLENKLQMGSNFLWLNYNDPDAQLAARTLNTWLAEYVKAAADLKNRNIVQFANILEGQLQYAEKATQDAEAAYQKFRVHSITLPTDAGPMAPGLGGMFAGDPALTSYFDQKIQYDNLRHDREAIEKSVGTVAGGGLPYEGLWLIPTVANGPGAEALRDALRSLNQARARLSVERQSFTDEYLPVRITKTSIDVLQKQTIPQLANQLLAQLREREADYQRRIQGASKELQAIPPRTIEEMRLKRAVAVAEVLYTNLKSRYAEAQLSAASAYPDVSVLDTAIAPGRPASKTAPMIVVIAIVGGLGIAIGLALLLDTMDKRLRYTDQVISQLGLGIAGAVPLVPKGGINASSPEQVVQFVESFRSLRMHVMNASPGERIALAVTSAAPGDGKSLVSANLALSFAEAGLRTVLIDGDTRRGSLHRMFGLKLTDGLTDYLAGSISETEVLRSTTHDKLSFVSCGRRNQHSPELLASAKLRRFVEQLSRSFDVVLFDTPPLAAGIDGFAISAAAGSILMVLRVGQTERRLASAKLAVLDRLPVDVLGAVLNGVPLTGEFQYYAYTSGYSVERGDPIGQLVGSAQK